MDRHTPYINEKNNTISNENEINTRDECSVQKDINKNNSDFNNSIDKSDWEEFRDEFMSPEKDINERDLIDWMGKKEIYKTNRNRDYIKYVDHINPSINDETRLDAPEPWGVFFQDNATPQMEGLEELHNNIMYYLAIILFAVTWILISIILNYTKSKISNKYINHGTLVELIWTVTPALILILIAFPSFKLLYLMDEVIDPSLVIYGEGHQWYWSYQYPDFTNNDEEFVEYDSYIIPESDLEKGKLRMLEVDNRVIIPELTHTRFVVAGADVIHSYACPALGIKCDAYPGRLNQSSVYLNREGTYFGQCSEICGILHSSMPISIQSVQLGKFLYWLYDQIGG